jgi:hypothetical protein
MLLYARAVKPGQVLNTADQVCGRRGLFSFQGFNSAGHGVHGNIQDLKNL